MQKSSQLTQFVKRAAARVLKRQGGHHAIGLRALRELQKVDARLAKHKARPVSGEEAFWIAMFYKSAALMLSWEGTPELKIGHRCARLAFRYLRLAERNLPNVNWCDARTELLIWRDMHEIEPVKTRKDLIDMTRCPDAIAYENAMTLLGSFTQTPPTKQAVAAVEKVIEHYEQQLASLRKELMMARTIAD